MQIKELIKYEKKKYFSTNKEYIKHFLINSDDYQIWKFQKTLRKAEHYNNKRESNKLYNVLYVLHKRLKNKRGRKLGFNIPEGCFLEGLRIYHTGAIAVNPAARIGKDCIVVGNLCIGNVEGLEVAPNIGNNCMFGWGSIAIGDISIADNCRIAAGAVVVKNVNDKDAVMVGVPARNVNK